MGWDIVLIGLIGGLVTGISPCILPVLPIVLAVSADKRRKPWLVATGIGLSFTLVTLLGTLILSALGLPKDLLRWAGVVLLVLVGASMLWPALGDQLERPFARIRIPGWIQRITTGGGSGFGIGLALGAVYSPCAGPVLAAVTVAGATGQIGWGNVVLAVSFAVGACTPLFFFALAGKQIGTRADFVRSHRKGISYGAGALVIVLAVAIAFNAPAALQRALPDWTSSAQEKFNASDRTRNALQQANGGSAGNAGNSGSVGDGSLESCRTAAPDRLQDCGPVPAFAGLEGWQNTETPVDPRHPAKVNGKQSITLVDFWAYACINCQRANEHVTKLYDRYRDSGLQVVGVHAPEYAFEHEASNVAAAIRDQGIHYPVAQDNNFATWRAFNNRYWPAHYLVDHTGKVRQIHEGEGAYAETERLVRELLSAANPGIELPSPVEEGGDSSNDATSSRKRNPETYLGTRRAEYFSNPAGEYKNGTHEFAKVQPEALHYSLEGKWKLAEQSIRPVDEPAVLHLNYQAKRVQLVVSGRGKISVAYGDGTTRQFPINSDGTVDILREPEQQQGELSVRAGGGVEFYSLTFG